MSQPYEGDALVGDLVNTEQFDPPSQEVARQDDGFTLPITNKPFIVRKTVFEIEFPEGNL
jgi:hypothetical protein